METNFKVDVPSFALGYSAGRKKGGGELNIAYGDTPPEDTSKLWVKTSQKVKKIVIRPVLALDSESANESLEETIFGSLVMETGVCHDGAKTYLVGGTNFPYQIRRYDFEKNEFKMLDVTLPTAVYWPACAAIGTKLYVFGGSSTSVGNPNQYVYEVDMEDGTVNTLSAQDKYKESMCVVIDGKIHLFGGRTSSNSSSVSVNHRVFDPDTKKIQTESSTPLPVATARASVGFSQNSVFFVGGYTNGLSNGIMVYDYVNNTMTSLVDRFATGIGVCGSCYYDGKLYIFGGRTDSAMNISGKSLTDVRYYDFERDEFIECQSKVLDDRGIASAREYNGAVYIFYHSSSKIMMFTRSEGTPYVEEGCLYVVIDKKHQNNVLVLNEKNAVAEISIKSCYLGNSNNEGEPVEAAIYKDGKWQTVRQEGENYVGSMGQEI